MGLLLTDKAKPNAKGSTTRGGAGGIFNHTKWDVGEGKADTAEDSFVSLSKRTFEL